MRYRVGVSDLVDDQLLAGKSLVIAGEHGSGRTTLLDRARGGGREVYLATGLDLLRSDGYDVISDALGMAVGPSTSIADLGSEVGDGVLAIDDVQWLGVDGRRMLLDAIGDGVQVIVTVATDEDGAEACIHEFTDAGATAMRLDPIDDSPRVAEDLAGRGFATDQVERRLDEAGGNLTFLNMPRDHVPPVVAAGLRVRLAALSEEERRVLALLRLARGPVPTSAVGLGPAEILVERGWVADDGANLSLRFGALGQAAVQSLTPEAVLEAHRVLAVELEPRRAASHLALAGDPVGAARSADEALPDADLSERPDLLAIVRAGTDPSEDGDRARHLAEAHVSALLGAGRVREAASLAQEVDLPVLAAAALRQLGRPVDAVEALGRAQDHPATVAGVRRDGELARLALWPGVGDERPRTIDLGERATTLAGSEPDERPRTDDRYGYAAPEAAAEVIARELLSGRIDSSAGLTALHAMTQEDRWDDAALATAALAIGAAARHGLADAVLLLDETATLWRDAPRGPWTDVAIAVRATLDLHRGARIEALQDDFGKISDRPHALPGLVAANLSLLQADLGRASDGLDVIAQTWQRCQVAGLDAGLLGWAEAEVELIAGRPRKAIRALERIDGLLDDPVRWPLLPQLRASTMGWARFAVAEPPPPAQGLSGVVAQELRAFELVHQATTGDQDVASDLLHEAASTFEAASAEWLSARATFRARWAAAEARRRAGDSTRAIEALRALETEAEEARLLPLLARVRQSLRRAGESARAPRATARRPPSDQEEAPAIAAASLSPREAEVMALIADGLTSSAIADRLGLGRATVESQISSAMRKLGARTRVQAAAMLRRRTS